MTMTDVIATNAAPGDNSLADILGGLPNAIQSLTNNIAALSAQNSDIANGRWTLNNAVYQFQQMPQATQAMVLAALAYIAVKVAA